MEKPTPFDLNEAIRHWQQNLGASPAFNADNLEELASHLRACVQKLKATGLSEEEAFQIAVRRTGERGPLEREFTKVNSPVAWSHTVLVFWLVAGVFLLQVAYSLISAFVFSLTSYRLWVFTHHEGHLTDLYRGFQYVDIQFGGAIAMVLFFSICARLVAGDWRRFNVFIRCFEHPLRTALSLTVLGLVPIALRFLIAFIGLPYSLPWRSALLGARWGLFRQGDFAESTLIVVWVLALVFLARHALRNNAAAR